jgi:hypothetical protein
MRDEPGRQTRSIGPSPIVWKAISTSPLLAYRVSGTGAVCVPVRSLYKRPSSYPHLCLAALEDARRLEERTGVLVLHPDGEPRIVGVEGLAGLQRVNRAVAGGDTALQGELVLDAIRDDRRSLCLLLRGPPGRRARGAGGPGRPCGALGDARRCGRRRGRDAARCRALVSATRAGTPDGRSDHGDQQYRGSDPVSWFHHATLTLKRYRSSLGVPAHAVCTMPAGEASKPTPRRSRRPFKTWGRR